MSAPDIPEGGKFMKLHTAIQREAVFINCTSPAATTGRRSVWWSCCTCCTQSPDDFSRNNPPAPARLHPRQGEGWCRIAHIKNLQIVSTCLRVGKMRINISLKQQEPRRRFALELNS